MPTFTLSSTDRTSPKILIPFLTLHGFLFLGISYILFTSFQVFALIHALIGIIIYLIFWRSSFPNLFRDLLIGSAVSVLTGVLFGDFLLDKFFFFYKETPRGIISKMYSSLIIFYVYFYTAFIKYYYRARDKE